MSYKNVKQAYALIHQHLQDIQITKRFNFSTAIDKRLENLVKYLENAKNGKNINDPDCQEAITDTADIKKLAFYRISWEQLLARHVQRFYELLIQEATNSSATPEQVATINDCKKLMRGILAVLMQVFKVPDILQSIFSELRQWHNSNAEIVEAIDPDYTKSVTNLIENALEAIIKRVDFSPAWRDGKLLNHKAEAMISKIDMFILILTDLLSKIHLLKHKTLAMPQTPAIRVRNWLNKLAGEKQRLSITSVINVQRFLLDKNLINIIQHKYYPFIWESLRHGCSFEPRQGENLQEFIRCSTLREISAENLYINGVALHSNPKFSAIRQMNNVEELKDIALEFINEQLKASLHLEWVKTHLHMEGFGAAISCIPVGVLELEKQKRKLVIKRSSYYIYTPDKDTIIIAQTFLLERLESNGSSFEEVPIVDLKAVSMQIIIELKTTVNKTYVSRSWALFSDTIARYPQFGDFSVSEYIMLAWRIGWIKIAKGDAKFALRIDQLQKEEKQILNNFPYDLLNASKALRMLESFRQ